MSNILTETSRLLQEQAAKHDSVLVSFSGGKDSLATLDLCCRTFRRVTCFFMYFIPGLDFIEAQLDYARQRWHVDILQYPHWTLFRALKNGNYCDRTRLYNEFPDVKLGDIHDMVRADTGIYLIANGGKEADSLWRRRQLRGRGGKAGEQSDTRGVIYPLKTWTKWDVLAFLKMRGIPIPDSAGDKKAISGVGLVTSELLWMHDHHPADFDKLCEVFPYARAVVYRREFYGDAA